MHSYIVKHLIRNNNTPTWLSSTIDGTIGWCMSAFVLGGFIGWAYEELIGIVEHGHFDPSHGGLHVPFLFVYGVGALLIEHVFGNAVHAKILSRNGKDKSETSKTRDITKFEPITDKIRNPLVTFLGICLLTTALEYSTGLFMLHVLGVRTWDYRVTGWDFLCTPDGLLCLRGVLSFAVAGMFLLYVLDKHFLKMGTKDRRKCSLVFTIVTIIIVIDAIISYGLGGTASFK